MACLETTFLIDILRGKRNIIGMKNELENESLLTVAAPTVMELWTGALLNKMPDREKTRIDELLASLTVLPLDERSSKAAAEIESILTKEGKTIETEDIMIAAIAQTNGEKLITRDEHYARIHGLKILKY